MIPDVRRQPLSLVLKGGANSAAISKQTLHGLGEGLASSDPFDPAPHIVPQLRNDQGDAIQNRKLMATVREGTPQDALNDIIALLSRHDPNSEP
jgi:hypothetical protein